MAETELERIKSLTNEKSLWGLWLNARNIPDSPANVFMTLGVFGLLAAYCFIAFVHGASVDIISNQVRSLADLGVNFSASILGFILAGFTIFASSERMELFGKLVQHTHSRSKLNFLKYNFGAFVKVFVIYLGYILLCLFVKLFGAPDGAASTLISFVFGNALLFKSLVIYVTFILLGGYTFYLGIALQSFIYNIYSSVMTGIRFELEAHYHENNASGSDTIFLIRDPNTLNLRKYGEMPALPPAPTPALPPASPPDRGSPP